MLKSVGALAECELALGMPTYNINSTRSQLFGLANDPIYPNISQYQ